MSSKKELTERDICTKYITPALVDSGWDLQKQIREEVTFTDGRIIVRKKLNPGERDTAENFSGGRIFTDLEF